MTNRWADLPEKDSIPSPPAIVLYGLEATGKTLVLRALLEATGTGHAWLACHECITARHLTERIGTTVSAVLGIPPAVQQRCESASALAVYLQQTLQRDGVRKHFLVRPILAVEAAAAVVVAGGTNGARDTGARPNRPAARTDSNACCRAETDGRICRGHPIPSQHQSPSSTAL